MYRVIPPCWDPRILSKRFMITQKRYPNHHTHGWKYNGSKFSQRLIFEGKLGRKRTDCSTVPIGPSVRIKTKMLSEYEPEIEDSSCGIFHNQRFPSNGFSSSHPRNSLIFEKSTTQKFIITIEKAANGRTKTLRQMQTPFERKWDENISPETPYLYRARKGKRGRNL